MSNRSGFVSLALFLVPTIFLITFRILSPELNEVLSNDTMDQIAVHSLGIIIGFILLYRYSRVLDHEYRRSKAIDSLSKIYKLEDKGLWDKGEVAIQKLEARAYSDFKGRKASTSRQRMQGNIGRLNREASEMEQTIDENPENTILLDEKGHHSTVNRNKVSLLSTISESFSKLIDRSAQRRKEKRKKEELRKKEKSAFVEGDGDSRWSVPEGIQRKARLCAICSTYNEPESNYCSSCGSIIN